MLFPHSFLLPFFPFFPFILVIFHTYFLPSFVHPLPFLILLRWYCYITFLVINANYPCHNLMTVCENLLCQNNATLLNVYPIERHLRYFAHRCATGCFYRGKYDNYIYENPAVCICMSKHEYDQWFNLTYNMIYHARKTYL